MAQKEQDSLAVHTKELTKDFDRWDYLYTHGGQDPFHSAGNLQNQAEKEVEVSH